MRSKLLILSLLICLNLFGQTSVPNTTTFNLQNVVDVVLPGGIAQVDSIYKSGVAANCTVTCNGDSQTMTWNTDATTTVNGFVALYSVSFPGVTLTNSGSGVCLFTGNTPGLAFTPATIDGTGNRATTITEASSDMDLSSCFTDAVAENFHPAYYPEYEGGVENSLLNFRAYNNWLIDVDMNKYRTMIIDDHEWMMSNLKVKHYANGVPIATTPWGANVGTYYYDEELNSYETAYGALYNWWTIGDANLLVYFRRNGVHEEGWRVPTEVEWGLLITYLGGNSTAGGKLKDVRINPPYWSYPNTGATNEYYWGGLPGGYIDDTGEAHWGYEGYGQGVFWTNAKYQSSDCDVSCATCPTDRCHCVGDACLPMYGYTYYGSGLNLYYNSATIDLVYYESHYGLSIRCVRDLP